MYLKDNNPGFEAREAARNKYRPEKINVLFVAEAPPAELDRFFYFENVSEGDYLYLETMKVVFGNVDIIDLRQRKVEFLEGFKENGFFLLDAVNKPIPQSTSSYERRDRVWSERNHLVEMMRKLVDSRTDVVLIKSTVFGIRDFLIKSDFHVINDEAIEFPSNGHQGQYRQKLSRWLGPFLSEYEGTPQGV